MSVRFYTHWVEDAAGGASHALEGASASVSTVVGDLTVTRDPVVLEGATAGVSTTTGSLTLALPLSGSTAGQATMAGALTSVFSLGGAAAGISTVSGDLAVLREPVLLVATTNGVSSMSGAMSVHYALEGGTGGGGGEGIAEGVVVAGNRTVYRTRVLEHAL